MGGKDKWGRVMLKGRGRCGLKLNTQRHNSWFI
jgi:hypothetical protein